MKYVLPMAVAMLLAGCSGGNDAAKQAEIDRLKAETEKLRAEAQQLRSQNDTKAALSVMSYGQAARCTVLAKYFRDKNFTAFSNFMKGAGGTESDVKDYLNGTISIAQNIATSKAESMDPRPDAASDTGAGAVQRIGTEAYLGYANNEGLIEEMKGVCRPVWESSEFKNPTRPSM